MGKLTWQQLGLLFGGSQFNLTPEEAAKLLADCIYKNWKTKDVGRPRDCRLLDEFLYEHDKLAKKYGKHKAVSHLYKSGAVKDFQAWLKLNGRATKLLEMIY